MRRLESAFLDRTKQFAHRMVDVAEALERARSGRMSRGRVIDQIVGCGTSVGSNTREADEAVSRPDFCKACGIVLRELGECRFWLEFVGDRNWLPAGRLAKLHTESEELTKVFHVMVARVRRNDRKNNRRVTR